VNEWSYTSTSQYTFMAWCSVKKHRDNFTAYCMVVAIMVMTDLGGTDKELDEA
jgi:hypothetical protein